MKPYSAIAALLMLTGTMLGQDYHDACLSAIDGYCVPDKGPDAGKIPPDYICTKEQQDPNRHQKFCVAAQPVDVPAIEKTRIVDVHSWQDGSFPCTPEAENCPQPTHKEPQKYWTCSDPKRVLLTSENGERHCILFGQN